MLKFDVGIEGAGPLLEPGAEEVAPAEVRFALERITARVEEEIKERMPVGVTGVLRGSVAREIEGTGVDLTGVVGTPQPYGLVIEEGRRPGKRWPPEDPIRLWVRRTAAGQEIVASLQSEGRLPRDRAEQGAVFLVRRKIGRKGFRGRHMFAEAAKATEGFVRDVWQETGERIAQRLNG